MSKTVKERRSRRQVGRWNADRPELKINLGLIINEWNLPAQVKQPILHLTFMSILIRYNVCVYMCVCLIFRMYSVCIFQHSLGNIFFFKKKSLFLKNILWYLLSAELVLQVMRLESESHSVMSDSLQPHGLYSPWNSPGQNTRVGRLSLLQGIFPTQGSDLGLLHCRCILYQLSPQGSPSVIETLYKSRTCFLTIHLCFTSANAY